MRLLMFRRSAEAKPEPGVLADDKVLPISPTGHASLLSLIEAGETGLEAVRGLRAQAQPDDLLDLSRVTTTAPLPRPPKLICVGLNYRDHAIESKLDIPTVPVIFNKFPSCVIGPNEPIVLPKVATKPDYEAEMAVVIGRRGRHVAAEDWRSYVFGYTIVNDVSARDYQMRTSQWLMGKTFDTFAPMGPYLVTADEVADPHELDIKLTINGEELQNSNTRHLIFRIPELLVELSSVFTLEPGDVISTGTPAGVGFARTPPRLLVPGDDVVVSVAGLGELRNPVVAEA